MDVNSDRTAAGPGRVESAANVRSEIRDARFREVTLRVESFIDTSGADVVHVRYTELLDDWRGVVQRIARRLGVPLAPEERANEVDSFLEAGMRTHQAADTEFDTHVAGATDEAIRALYRRLLQRCERDAADAAKR